MVQTSKDSDSTSYKDTKHGIISRPKLIQLESKGLVKGFRFIQSKRFIKLTPEFISELHKKSFGHIFDWAGLWRTIDVRFGNLETSEPHKIPVLVNEYCKDAEERFLHLPKQSDTNFFFEELVKFLAWLQHRFIVIHPFNDYNGRIGRLITNWALLRLQMPIIEIRVDSDEDKRLYLNAMRKADEHDYSGLEVLLYNALTESLQRNLQRL